MAIEEKGVVCGLCSGHCRVVARVEDGRFLGLDPRRTPVPGCHRAQAAAEYVYHPMRLNYPLKRVGGRGEGKWQRVSWGEALDDTADRLQKIKDTYGPEAVAYCCTGETNCCLEYRVRSMSLFGSPNNVSSMQICFGPAMQLALMLSGWIGNFPFIGPETRCFMLIGANPPVTMPALWRGLLQMKKHLGLKLIVIDPRPSQAASRADIWLQLRPNTDSALMLAMIHTIITEGLYDKEFVEKWCHGWDKLRERVKDYPPEKMAEVTWVPAEKIREAARLYAKTKPGAILHCMGVEEQPNCLQAIFARFILPAITGNLDIPGGEALSEPHPGIRVAAEYMEIDKIPPEKRAKMFGADKFRYYSWPMWQKVIDVVGRKWKQPVSTHWWAGSSHGPTAFRAMVSGKPYPVKAIIQESQNPFLTFSNAKLVYQGYKNVDFIMAMDVFMTPSCELADYVLPAACCFEKPVLWGGDYFHWIVGGPAAIPPLYERKPEYYMWRELGLRLGQDWPWKTLEEALDYRLEPMGITLDEFVKRGGYDEAPRHFKKYEEGGFGTRTGKFELYSTLLEEFGYDPLPSWKEPPRTLVSDPELAKGYPMILTGCRRLHYFHSQYRQLQSLRKKHPDPLAQISPAKGKELGIDPGDWIWIETPLGKAKFKCEYRNMDPQVVEAEFGWWFPEEPGEEPSLHGVWRSNINALLDDDPDTCCDPICGAWQLRGQQCKIYKAVELGHDASLLREAVEGLKA